MPPTADQLTLARSWIGTSEETAVFTERFDRLGAQYGFDEKTLDRAIEESLRAQLAVLTLDQPTSLTVGDVTMSFGQAIISLQTILKDFLASGGTRNDETAIGGATFTKLYRQDLR